MKKIIYLIVFSFTVLTSCDLDDYLNKTPLDSITDVDYWKSASDLQLYVNQFYTMLPQFPSWGGGGYLWEDNNSDNMASRFYDNRLAGTNTITTNNGSWDYSRIRSINIMLNKYKEMSVSESEIAPYVGEAYFFRAFAYFNLVRQYGDVPYVSQVLTPPDSEELFAARTPPVVRLLTLFWMILPRQLRNYPLKPPQHVIASIRSPLFYINREWLFMKEHGRSIIRKLSLE